MSIKSKALIRAEKLLPGNQDFTSITNDIAGVPEQKGHQFNGGCYLDYLFLFYPFLLEVLDFSFGKELEFGALTILFSGVGPLLTLFGGLVLAMPVH